MTRLGDFNLSRSSLLATLDRFLDSQLAFKPPAQAYPSLANWARNFHAAPQLTFLSTYGGKRHNLHQLGNVQTLHSDLAQLLPPGALTKQRDQASYSAAARTTPEAWDPLIAVAHHPTNHTLVQRLAAGDVLGSPALTRKLCHLLLADFCCFNFALPHACAGMPCHGNTTAQHLRPRAPPSGAGLSIALEWKAET